MRKRFRLGTYVAIAAFGILDPALADSFGDYPSQQPYQKDGRPEAGPEGEPEAGPEDEQRRGGYAAPPRSGSMTGPTSSLGLDGLELEIPALKLKLPKIRFPCLTRYHTPAKMIVDEAIAPFVQNFRQEFSVEAGPEAGPARDPEAGPARDPEAGPEQSFPKPYQKPSQKSDISPAQVSYEQARLEQRVRELEELLVRVESSVSSSSLRNEPPSRRRVPEVSRTPPSTRAPEPLPAVSVARPASFEVPDYPIARIPVGRASRPRHLTANEVQLAELKELVISMQQQQHELLQQMSRQQVVASNWEVPHGSSPGWNANSGAVRPRQIPNRLPRVVR